jgi:hypothetical protein
MIDPASDLKAKLKVLGFAQGNQMKLYGKQVEIRGELIVVRENLVLVDVVDAASGEQQRVAVPLPIVQMAAQPQAGQQRAA